MSSWFDITSLDPKEFGYNFNDILNSAKVVEKYIEKEYDYFQDYNSIYLGGFS